MANSQYITPHRFFLAVVVLVGTMALVFMYCLWLLFQTNRLREPLQGSEQSIRAVGKAYVYLGYYELREFYLVSTNEAVKQRELCHEMDSLWTKLMAEISIYQQYTPLKNPTAENLLATLTKYRKNSLLIKKQIQEKQNTEALLDLQHGNHHKLLKQLEELFQDIIELLPDHTQKLLETDKSSYQRNLKGLQQVRSVFIWMVAVAFIIIWFLYKSPYKGLLYKRLTPLLLISLISIEGVCLLKPAPRYKTKYALVKDYTRFINFMTYFNHYKTLECRHIFDTSRLIKKQIEEEMEVYRRSVRQALRGSRKKFGGKFKKEVGKLQKLRAKYFSKAVVPSLVFSFNKRKAEALRLLLPVKYQADTLTNELAPDEVTYPEEQNALFTNQFHEGFDKILQTLDKHYIHAPQKLYQQATFMHWYQGFLIVWLLVFTGWIMRFYRTKKWIVYKAKAHFLPKKQLT